MCIFQFFQKWICTYLNEQHVFLAIWNALQPNCAFLNLRNSKKTTKFKKKISHLFWHVLSSGKISGRFFFKLCVLFRKSYFNLAYVCIAREFTKATLFRAPWKHNITSKRKYYADIKRMQKEIFKSMYI